LNQVFISWSGGKDSCFAAYLAETSGLKISCLANMITEDGKLSWSHGQSPELLQLHAKATGISLHQQRTSSENYEAEFINMLQSFKGKGIGGGVFGDIDFNEHRQWIERVCKQADITPHLPLWGKSQDDILREFIALGFETVIVATRADLLGEEWLGGKVDKDFLEQLSALKDKKMDITLCGEAGEYHTFVTNGPLFNKRIEILETRKFQKDNHWFLEILDTELREK